MTDQFEVLEGVLGSATAALQEGRVGGEEGSPDEDASRLLLGQAAGTTCKRAPWDTG